ncbi:MAG TPA: VWA domain-containing protein [Candidatus Acidoferrum sp.]|nr:VWA domain-containing protein [Candidatus Acidoferrum sp.]
MRELGWKVFCNLLLAFSVSLAYHGQGASTTIKVQVRLVEVYASVHDQKGHFVDGLSRESFQVLEDGKPQQIAAFDSTFQSLSCAILLDTTGSMSEALPRVKNSIVKLIDELGPEDSVAIYTFDQRLVVRQDFTTDKSAAKRAALRTRAEGATALFDALSEAAQELSQRSGKKALILFTDGDDNSSALNASAAVARAKKAGVPLYTIAEGEATHSKDLKKLLDDLSQRTGGAAYEVKKPGEIEQVFHDVSEDLRHLYMISYKPPEVTNDGKWRKIDLLVKGVKDYRIRAKEGYFAE